MNKKYNICMWGFDDKLVSALKERVADTVVWFGATPDADYDLLDTFRNSDYLEIQDYKFTQEQLDGMDEIYNDEFQNFSKIMSRFAIYILEEFTLNDYINIFRIYLKLAYYILTKNKIDVMIFSYVPHEQLDYVLYIVAKKLNIKILMLTEIVCKELYIVIDAIEKQGDFDLCKDVEEDMNYELPEITVPKYMITEKNDGRYYTSYNNFLRSKTNYRNIRSFLRGIGKVINHYDKKRSYTKKLDALIDKNIDLDKDFVYCGLHLQPEVTVFPCGGMYSDQILVLERLAELLPDDMLIYVKENPKQTHVKREYLWFNRIRAIKNIRFVPNDTNSFELIKKAKFVATVTGTLGWEGLRWGKPALVFGDAWYKNFEGVFRYSSDLDYSEILNYKIDTDKLKADYNKIRRKCIKTVAAGDSYYPEYIENLANVFTSYISD